MTQAFWDGFEKQASLGSFIGRTIGKAKGAIQARRVARQQRPTIGQRFKRFRGDMKASQLEQARKANEARRAARTARRQAAIATSRGGAPSSQEWARAQASKRVANEARRAARTARREGAVAMPRGGVPTANEARRASRTARRQSAIAAPRGMATQRGVTAGGAAVGTKAPPRPATPSGQPATRQGVSPSGQVVGGGGPSMPKMTPEQRKALGKTIRRAGYMGIGGAGVGMGLSAMQPSQPQQQQQYYGY